jgi:LacI family transcriptional regulator
MRVVPLPARELGETAAGLLLDRIAGDDGPPRTVVLHTRGTS